MLDVVLLEVVHQVGSIALREALSQLKTHRPPSYSWRGQRGASEAHLDLLVGRDGAEDDLREALRRKHPEADPTDHAAVFDEGERLVFPVGKERGVSRRVTRVHDGRRHGQLLTGRTPAA